MTWTWVQDSPGGGALTSKASVSTLPLPAFGSPNTPGNIIVACYVGDAQDSTPGNLTCTDNAATPNTYTRLFFSFNSTSGACASAFVATINSLPVSGNLQVTFNLAGGVSLTMSGSASEFSGGTTTLDGGSGVGYNTHNAHGTNPTPGSITTATNGDLVVSLFAEGASGTVSITKPSGFTTIGINTAGSTYNEIGGTAYLIQAAHGATNAAWTVATGYYAAGQAALKAAVAAVDDDKGMPPDLVFQTVAAWNLPAWLAQDDDVLVVSGGSFSLSLDAGSYTLTGEPTTFAVSLPVSAGVYSLTGELATFAVALPVAVGSYSLTGEPATFGVTIPVDAGVYTLTGDPVTFAAAVALTASTGSYSLTGESTVFGVALVAVAGAYSLTGEPVVFAAAASLAADLGTYILTGEPAVFAVALPSSAGSYSLVGQAAVLGVGLPASVGAYSLVGEPAAFVAQATLALDPGAYTLTGEPATLVPGSVVLPLDTGIYVLTGEDVAFSGPIPAPVAAAPPSTALNEASGTAGGYAVPSQWVPTGWLAGEPGSAPYYPPPLPPVRRTIVELTGEAEPGGFGLVGSGVSFARHSPAPPAPTRTEKIPGGRQVPTRRVKPLPRPPHPRSYRLASARGACRVRGLAVEMVADDTRFRQLRRLDDLLVLRGFDALPEAEQEVFGDGE